MFHKAIALHFREGTALEVTFQDSVVKRYDYIASWLQVYDKY